MSERIGRQTPIFHRAEPWQKTEGKYATELATAYALKPHPWQALVLDDWLAVDDKGVLIHHICYLMVPRQNGKTGDSEPRETWGLVKRAERILHTAQEFQTAKIAFDRLRKKFGDRRDDPMAKYPELNALVDKYTTSAGQMVLDLKNGGHIEFRTRGNSSDMGRGGTFDLIVVDEAQSYTQAQDASLSPLNSAAPSGSPQTILMGTPPTPEAEHKGFIFKKQIDKMHDEAVPGACIHEWSTREIGDVSDRDRWYECNPSLGFQLLVSALEKDLISMTPDAFAREHLGYLAKTITKENYALDRDKWSACKSDQLKPEGKTAYGIKFSPDGSTVCLSGAVIDKDGIARISVIEQKSTAAGVQWLADWLNARANKASCVVIDGKNGVDVLNDKIKDIWKAQDSIIRPTANQVIASASLLVDEIGTKQLTWYSKQEILNESAKNATKRPIGKGWGFGGETSGPIESCALALWGVRNSKRVPGRKQRIG